MSFICDCCKGTISGYDYYMFYTEHGASMRYCPDCAKKHSVHCNCCGQNVLKSEMTEYEGEKMCYVCKREKESLYTRVCDYHDHKDEQPIFFSLESNSTSPLFLGIELEVDYKDQYASSDHDENAFNAMQLFPKKFIYCEEDGSLNNGFELITQPATVEYHKSIMRTYKKAFRQLVSNKYRSHNTSTCGLHIHFNRSFFEKDENLYVERLLSFTDKYWDNMVKFSRRKMRGLNNYAAKYSKAPKEVVADMVKGHSDRYRAINLSNEDTIEFRIFRGTLNTNTFFATIELVESIVNAVVNAESDEAFGNLKWEDILNTEGLKTYWESVKDRVIS